LDAEPYTWASFLEDLFFGVVMAILFAVFQKYKIIGSKAKEA
jgi:hypothetical protein